MYYWRRLKITVGFWWRVIKIQLRLRRSLLALWLIKLAKRVDQKTVLTVFNTYHYGKYQRS